MDNPTTTQPRNPYIEADRMFFIADQQIKDSQTTEALENLLAIVEKYPDYGRAYNHMGFLYETKYRNYRKAEECYKKALELAPEYPPAYLNCSALLSTLEKFSELEELLNKALTVGGINRDRLYNEFGLMYEMQKKYANAIESFSKAVLHSLSDTDISTYKKNIERCKMKQQFLFEMEFEG
jgi:Tfp pilus assembly protein PilF